MKLPTLHAEARKNIALLTQLLTAVLERFKRTRELLARLRPDGR